MISKQSVLCLKLIKSVHKRCTTGEGFCFSHLTYELKRQQGTYPELGFSEVNCSDLHPWEDFLGENQHDQMLLQSMSMFSCFRKILTATEKGVLALN